MQTEPIFVKNLNPDLPFKILIHGGAWDIPDSLVDDHLSGVEAAYQLGHRLLADGKDPLETIVEVLCHLEDDPTFDAGFGSFLTEEGSVELDAAVMEGKDLMSGAVGAVSTCKNPSRLAYQVMKQTYHALLVGPGADKFSISMGNKTTNPADLVLEREVETHKHWLRSGKPDPRIYFSQTVKKGYLGSSPEKRGTVGVVVAVKKHSRWKLFSGTSTGGIPGKKIGRIGDVPIVGAGIYADDESCAVSCTGWGEALLRYSAASRVNSMVTSGVDLDQAVTQVLQGMKDRLDGRGGIIAVDHRGQCCAVYSTPRMAYAGPVVPHSLT